MAFRSWENGSTTQDGRGWVHQRSWERRKQKGSQKFTFKKKRREERLVGYSRKILLVNKKIFYIRRFKFLVGCEEIRFHDAIIKRVNAR